MIFQNINTQYKEVKRDPIQYTYCRNFNYLSRYKSLRQVIHEGNSKGRFVAFETTNAFNSYCKTKSYVVTPDKENRLDLIAQEQLGSASYAWVIAYFNNLADGFTVLEGTTLIMPVSITALFDKGEILSSISVNKLNLGSE